MLDAIGESYGIEVINFDDLTTITEFVREPKFLKGRTSNCKTCKPDSVNKLMTFDELQPNINRLFFYHLSRIILTDYL